MSNSETMTKIRISNDQNLFFEGGCFKFGAFEILIFEFVSNFVFRYSDLHPFATQTTKEAFVSSPQDVGHDYLPPWRGWVSKFFYPPPKGMMMMVTASPSFKGVSNPALNCW